MSLLAIVSTANNLSDRCPEILRIGQEQQANSGMTLVLVTPVGLFILFRPLAFGSTLPREGGFPARRRAPLAFDPPNSVVFDSRLVSESPRPRQSPLALLLPREDEGQRSQGSLCADGRRVSYVDRMSRFEMHILSNDF